MFSIPAFFWIAVVSCALLFVLPYVLGPILVRAKFWVGARPEVTHAFEAHLPAQTNAYFMYAEALFSVHGFRPCGDVRVQQFTDRQMTEIRGFRNEQTVESGSALCVRQQLPDGSERMECVLSVSSEHDGGGKLTTSNSDDIGPDLSSPEHREIRLPGVMSVDTLLRVHRMCAAELGAGSTRVLPPVGSELSTVREGLRRQTALYVERGLLALDHTGRHYRLTWIGAIELSWRQLWPVKQLLVTNARRRARRLVARTSAVRSGDASTRQATSQGPRHRVPTVHPSQQPGDYN